MCVAVIIPAGAQFPSYENLIAMEAANGAGGGIAYLDQDLVHYKKGITAEEMNEIILNITPPALIHFRIPTTGGNDLRLCHPFPISTSAETDLEGFTEMALIHNGTFYQWRNTMIHLAVNGKEFPDFPWSDTRAMAYITSYYGLPFLEFIEEKVAVLDKNGRIYRFGKEYEWSTKDGVQYSNMGWENKLPKKSSTTYVSKPIESTTQNPKPALNATKNSTYLNEDFEEANKASEKKEVITIVQKIPSDLMIVNSKW